MDSELRISRSKVGIVDQLRVFVRAGETMDQAEEEGEDLFYETAMSQKYMDEIAIDSEPSDVESPEPEPEVTAADAPSDVESEVTDADAPPDVESEVTDTDAPSDVEPEVTDADALSDVEPEPEGSDADAPSDVEDDLQA